MKKAAMKKALWMACLILGIQIWEDKLKESFKNSKQLREKVTVINKEGSQDLT